MRRPPGSAISHHGVEDGEQLPHARYQSYFLELARGYEALVERLDVRVVAAGDQRSHVERLPNLCPAAPDATAAPEDPRVSVKGSHAHECRKLPGRKGAQLGKLREQRARQNGTNSRHATKQRLVFLEGWALVDDLLKVAIYSSEFFFEPPYVSFEARANLFGGARAETVLLGDHHPDDLPSTSENRLKLQRFGLGRSFGSGSDGLGETSEDKSIDLVGLGEAPRGLGEVSRLARIEHRHCDLRGGQSCHQRTLVAAGGLKDHQRGTRLNQLLGECLNPLFVVSEAQSLSPRKQNHVQASFADVDADMDFLGNAQAASPFSPVGRPILAGTGSEGRSPAQATVRAPPALGRGARRPQAFLRPPLLGPRRLRSVAPMPTDCRQKPKHKENQLIYVVLRRSPDPGYMGEHDCAMCDVPFEVGAVYADCYPDGTGASSPLCPACLEHLGKRNPKKF